MSKFEPPYIKGIKWQDLIGVRFGKLVVKEYIPGKERKGQKVVRPKCVCQCDCGREHISTVVDLKRGHTTTCGSCKKHGMTNSLTYQCWSSMKSRCTNPNAGNYENYGEKGIKVCERWLNSFLDFLSDVGERPSKLHTLDRYPNKNGDYEPGNTRWATPQEQGRNKNKTCYYTYLGETKPVLDWADMFRVNGDLLWSRLKRGWSFKEAVEKPVGKNSRRKGNFISHAFSNIQ